MTMAVLIVDTVVDALNEAGIPACYAYPGGALPEISEARAAVNLEKLEFPARSATVLVMVIAPVTAGGAACQEKAVQVGEVLEALGGSCVQEECRFDGYADAYSIRVLGTFYGSAVMEHWEAESDFSVKIGENTLSNAVAFRAEQAVDAVTGEPLSAAVWTFRLEEKFGKGQRPLPSPAEPFLVTVTRSGSTEIYTECNWISVQLENTTTGLRQVRQGVAKSRAFAIVG